MTRKTAALLATLLLALAYLPRLAWAADDTATIVSKVRVFQEYRVSVSGLKNEFSYQIVPREKDAPLPVDDDGETFDSFTLRRDDDLWLEFPVRVVGGSSTKPYTYTYTIKPATEELSDGLHYVDILSTSLSAGVNVYYLELYVQPAYEDASATIVTPLVHVEDWDGPKVSDPGWRVGYNAPEKAPDSSGKSDTANATTTKASQAGTTSSTSSNPLTKTGDDSVPAIVLACIAYAGALLLVYARLLRRKAGDGHEQSPS